MKHQEKGKLHFCIGGNYAGIKKNGNYKDVSRSIEGIRKKGNSPVMMLGAEVILTSKRSPKDAASVRVSP